MTEGDQEAEKALDGELAELAAEHFGDVGLLDAEQSGGLRLFQETAFQDCIDLVDELRLDQVLFSIGDAEILEYVSASDFIPMLFHVSLLTVCRSFSCIAISLYSVNRQARERAHALKTKTVGHPRDATLPPPIRRGRPRYLGGLVWWGLEFDARGSRAKSENARRKNGMAAKIELPEDIERYLGDRWGDLPRHALEALALRVIARGYSAVRR